MAEVQQAAESQTTAAGAPVNPIPLTSLYVGDLDPEVSDSQLYDLFAQVVEVVSVRVCRDVTTRRSLGYAYVNFTNPGDAAKALDTLNFTPLNNKPIRIMYSNRDPNTRSSSAANIFIKNLDKGIDNKALHDTFSTFGNIVSCKIAVDPAGQSKGYGYVQFEREEAAQDAIEKLNGMALNDKVVYVGPFLPKQERENTIDNENKEKFSNVFVKNLSESTTEEDLLNVFGKFGQITSSVVMRDDDGRSKCFGFVNFSNPDAAAQAIQELNGKRVEDKEWYVGKALKKSERERELKGRFEQGMKEVADKYLGVNLYLKNLDDNIDDDQLKELFSSYGTITSCKVMRDPNGISKGSGFVAFSSPEEASRALAEMNGKMVGSKPLYVAHAQRKEERKARLQAQFSQLSPGMSSAAMPRMPMFPPGAPGLGQQFFYGQAPPALIAPQPGFGYPQQMVPGMRPGGAPMPNYFMPMVQQGGQQHAQRPVGRRGGQAPGQFMPHQTMQFLPHQMMPNRGRGYGYPPQGRNMPSGPMQSGGFNNVPSHDREQQPLSALSSALANASPSQQRMMLGENLYPLVAQIEPDHAAKVTGMLLEMDQTEVLHLLESPESLKAKVGEAMEVLKDVAQQHQQQIPHGQMASLSLNGE